MRSFLFGISSLAVLNYAAQNASLAISPDIERTIRYGLPGTPSAVGRCDARRTKIVVNELRLPFGSSRLAA